MQPKHILVALLCLPLLGGGIYFLARDDAAGVDYDPWETGAGAAAEDLTGAGADQGGTLNGAAPAADPDDETSNTERTELGDGEVARGPAIQVPRPPVLVHGRVVNRFRAAVAGARIQLTLGPPGRGRRNRVRIEEPLVTRPDGSFQYQGEGFPDLEVGLRVTHRDYALTLFQDTFQGIDSDGDVDLGEVEMVTGGSLAGTVTDMAGVVLPGAEARLLPQDGMLRRLPDRGKVFPPVQCGNSGFFRIEHVPPGQYRVVGVAPHRQRRYTGVITVADAEEVVLDPIQLGPGFQLTGRVFRPEGGPVPNAEVKLLSARGWGRAQRGRTDGEGRFDFDHLAAGSYSLEVRARGYLRHRQAGIQVERAPELNITLVNGLRVSGVLLDAVTNQPITLYAARVRRIQGLADPEVERLRAQYADMRRKFETMRRSSRQRRSQQPRQPRKQRLQRQQRQQMRRVQRKLREVAVKLRQNGVTLDRRGRSPREGRRSPWQDLPRDAGKPEAHPAGRFAFDGLEEGIYVVDFSAPTHQRLRSERIELRRGGVTPHLTLHMDRGLLVAGRVLDRQSGKPIPDARVDLRILRVPGQPGQPGQPRSNGRPNPWRELRRRFQGPAPQGIGFLNTRTDKNGGFRLQQAGPGTYQLMARADGHARELTEPFELSQDVEDQDLVLGRLGVIHGRVHNVPPGKLDQARVVVSDLRRHRTVKLDPDHTYRVEDLQPGSYMVRAFVGSFDAYRRSSMRRFRAAGGDPAQIRPDVKIKEGSVVEFDTGIDQDPVGGFRGQILVNGFGSAARGFRIHLREIDPMGPGAPRLPGPGRWRPNRASTRADQKGHYRFEDVMAGQYTMSIRAPGRRGIEVHRQTVYISEDSDNVQPAISLTLGTFAGRVHPDGMSADNPEAPRLQKQLRGSVQLLPGIREMPANWNEFRRNNLVFGGPVRQGRFRFQNVPVGEYLMVLRVRGFAARLQQVFVDGSPVAQEYRTGKRRRPRKPKPDAKGKQGKKNSKAGAKGKPGR